MPTLLLLLAGMQLSADTVTLSVEEVFARALETSPAVAATAHRADAARADIRRAGAWADPSLAFVVENVGQRAGTGGTAALEGQAVLTLPIPYGRYRTGPIRMAEARADATDAAARGTVVGESAVTLDLIGAFLLAQAHAESAWEEWETLAGIARELAVQAEAGRAATGDAARAALERATAAAQYARRSAHLTTTGIELSRRIGLPLDRVLSIRTQRCGASNPPVPGVEPDRIVPEVGEARAWASWADAAVAAAGARRLPRLEPQVGLRRTDGTSALYLGLQTSLPVFGLGSRSVDVARAEARAAGAELDEIESRAAASLVAAERVLAAIERAGTNFDDAWSRSLALTVEAAAARFSLGESSLSPASGRAPREVARHRRLRGVAGRLVARPCGALARRGDPARAAPPLHRPFPERRPMIRQRADRTLLALLIVLGSCGGDEPAAQPSPDPGGVVVLTEAQIRNAGIETEIPTRRSIRPTVSLPGTVQPPDTAHAVAGSIVEGRVEVVHVVPGDLVRAGQTLVEIHSHELSDAQADLTAARAEEAYERAALDRAELLLEAGAIALEEVERRRASHTAAEAEVARSQELVDHLYPSTRGSVRIVSPRQGTVFEVRTSAGEAVLPGTPLVEVGAIAPLWVTVFVPENTATALFEGDTVRASFRGLDDRVPAVLVRAGSHVRADTRAVEMRFELLETPRGIRMGSFATVAVPSGEESEGIELPADAAVRMESGDAVFVVDGPGRFRPVPVSISPLAGGHVAVLGLADGAEVVVRGAYFLKAALEAGGEEGES